MTQARETNITSRTHTRINILQPSNFLVVDTPLNGWFVHSLACLLCRGVHLVLQNRHFQHHSHSASSRKRAPQAWFNPVLQASCVDLCPALLFCLNNNFVLHRFRVAFVRPSTRMIIGCACPLRSLYIIIQSVHV